MEEDFVKSESEEILARLKVQSNNSYLQDTNQIPTLILYIFGLHRQNEIEYK